ncbi:hypothetical protein R1sor_007228 [Riccia sorocarpa]|uniref:Uncharacterized protein n=1 Tax=Riccia sorocarpa TaxID=122646 RepID=A0ABD3HST2_9MARC
MSSMVQQSAPLGGIKRTGEAPGVWPPTSLRVKRSMLGGRRIICGPSTPVPRWKLYENPFYDGIAAAAAAAAQQQQQQNANAAGGRNATVSARKLAATLWELQELPLALASSKSQACPCSHYRPSTTGNISKRSRDHLLALADNANANNGMIDASPDQSPRHSSFSYTTDHSPTDLDKESVVSAQLTTKGAAWDGTKKSSVSNSRQVAAMRSHVHRLLERRADSRLAQIASASANPASLMVLNRIRGLEEQQQMPQVDEKQQHHNEKKHQQDQVSQQHQQVHATPSSVVTALRMEVERARAKVHELELAQKTARREMEALVKKVAEEKAMWRSKEQEKVRVAVQAVKLEIEEEKKVRRRVESVNRKMSRELVEANLAVAKAVNELERERKARELMEDVCDELAREIGEDKAEVEELKRESAKVREEVEEERKMLQMAEVWREERVQMKLTEARLEVEEKCAMLDQLKCELEAFLHRVRVNNCQPEDESRVKQAEELKMEVDSLNMKEMLNSACLYPEANRDGAASDLYETEAPGNENSGDEKSEWGWAPAVPSKRWEATKLQGHAGELGHKLESREQVLERLRRKYADQNGRHQHYRHQQHHHQLQRSSKREESQEDSNRQWEAYTSDQAENDRDGGSDWNSQEESEGVVARGDDARHEEDGSQWESASDQDIEGGMQASSNSNPSIRGVGGADELRGAGLAASEAAAAASPETAYSMNNVNLTQQQHQQQHQLHQQDKRQRHQRSGSELSSGDDSRKAASSSSPVSRSSKVLKEDRSRSEGGGSRSSRGRATLEVPRNSHLRLAAEQGVASPSRDWRSPDRGNPHIARGIKGFIEWPKMSRDTAVRGKVSDSKVEKTDRRVSLRQNA